MFLEVTDSPKTPLALVGLRTNSRLAHYHLCKVRSQFLTTLVQEAFFFNM